MPVTDPRYPRHAHLWPLISQRLPVAELAHDAEHVLRVYHWCLLLAPEADVDADEAGAAGLVHDVVFIPKHLADRPLGGERSAAVAADLLPRCGYDEEETVRVVEAVRTCSWSRGLVPTAGLGRVLQDADRLDAIGAIGLARLFGTAQFMAQATGVGAFYHPGDPAATGERELDDRRWAVDHMRRKLLRLADGMHLATARLEAERRHARLVVFLEDLLAEVKG